jgi:hypothetical protein
MNSYENERERLTQGLAWLDDAERRFPMGAKVRVVKCEYMPGYVGVIGVVEGCDLENPDEEPLVNVRFEKPIDCGDPDHPATYDGFLVDEIMPHETEAT